MGELTCEKNLIPGDSCMTHINPHNVGGHQKPLKGWRFHHPKKGHKDLPGLNKWLSIPTFMDPNTKLIEGFSP